MTTQELSIWLNKNVKEVRTLIEVDADQSNPHELTEKLKQLAAMTATMAMIQGTAKKLLLIKQKELIGKLPDHLSPSLQSKWLSGELFEEESMVTYVDRLGAGLSNSIEAIRSVLSYTKTELENSRHQQG